MHYKRFLLIRMIEFTTLLDSFILRFGLHPKTIQNCFKHCGFKQASAEYGNIGNITTTTEPENGSHIIDHIRIEGVEFPDNIHLNHSRL